MDRKNNGEETGIQLSGRVSGSGSDSQDCYKLKKRRGGEERRGGGKRGEEKEDGRERRRKMRGKRRRGRIFFHYTADTTSRGRPHIHEYVQNKMDLVG